jgi:mitogen-activated protein kinase organizer 1
MSGHADRSVRLWNSNCNNSHEKLKEIALFDGAHNRDIFDVTIFADNAKFVTCGGDKLLFLWDVLKG